MLCYSEFCTHSLRGDNSNCVYFGYTVLITNKERKLTHLRLNSSSAVKALSMQPMLQLVQKTNGGAMFRCVYVVCVYFVYLCSWFTQQKAFLGDAVNMPAEPGNLAFTMTVIPNLKALVQAEANRVSAVYDSNDSEEEMVLDATEAYDVPAPTHLTPNLQDGNNQVLWSLSCQMQSFFNHSLVP